MIDTRYNPATTEDKWYQHWIDKKYFSSTPDEREPFTIVIPPPNVTGVLHMGHMLNNTIQDILVRKARMEGKNACWVPGTDHASIATEAKVVNMLRERGIKKSDLTREEFLAYAWEWKEKYGGIILQQLKKLGASCDWERTAFTMDETRSKAVLKAFVDLYRKGKLYRGNRMVNWDPAAQTVLSNEEVLYAEEQSMLYHVRYKVVGENDYITIATTRPETILGDSAVAVHPDDERYAKYKGMKVEVPLIGREIPIIFDDYVDREFGTGALKVTPAHDVNDYEIGKRHELKVIDVFNADGTMSEAAQLHIGKDRFEVRKLIAKDLEASENLVKTENYKNNVGRSERTNVVVEPRLSLQWYVDMKAIAAPALKAVMDDDVEFFPKNQKNTYRHWMENIRDWCISRQLWWGHQIPAWHYGEEVFVAETVDEALAEAKIKLNNAALTIADLKQEEDVLDTWFSSWLWPISLFDGFNSKEEIDYYYPTSVLVTGWDIIYLWVARMVMAGYEWKNEKPFDHVYFTGMVRDKQRRKMSKQLGNSPDALKLIEDFGADGVRFGMMSCSPAGGDLLFDDKLCEQGRNFSNKIWTALRLVKGWTPDESIESTAMETLASNWINEKFNSLVVEVEQNFKEYRLSEALISTYSFIWNDFCSWYLEMIKPESENISSKTYHECVDIFEKCLKLLHPFMPFITEEIWHQLAERKEGEDCMIQQYPSSSSFDNTLIEKVELAKDIISKIREVRAKNGLKMREELRLSAIESDNTKIVINDASINQLIAKLGFLESIKLVKSEDASGVGFIAGTDKFFVDFDQEVDIAAELEVKEKDLKYQQGFVKSVSGKLNNAKFVDNAPAQVVENERNKLADGQERIKQLTEEIERLKGLV
jgi:valyl-tRNA synthetase